MNKLRSRERKCIPNIRLAGRSRGSTGSRIPARPHPSITTPGMLPAEAAKRSREGREAGPTWPPEDDYWVTVKTKGTSRRRRNVPGGRTQDRPLSPRHSTPQWSLVSAILPRTHSDEMLSLQLVPERRIQTTRRHPPILMDEPTLERWDRGKMSSKRAESPEPIINLNNSELESSQRH